MFRKEDFPKFVRNGTVVREQVHKKDSITLSKLKRIGEISHKQQFKQRFQLGKVLHSQRTDQVLQSIACPSMKAQQ